CEGVAGGARAARLGREGATNRAEVRRFALWRNRRAPASRRFCVPSGGSERATKSLRAAARADRATAPEGDGGATAGRRRASCKASSQQTSGSRGGSPPERARAPRVGAPGPIEVCPARAQEARGARVDHHGAVMDRRLV